MADHEPSDEYREFVESLVPLDEAQGQRDERSRSPFEALAGRIAGTSGLEFGFSFVSGAGLLLIAATLAALMPSRVEGSFWRVGRDVIGDMLAVGNGAALPLAIGGLALLALAGLASLRGGPIGRSLLIAQPFIGGAGVASMGALWTGFLALAVLNFIVLLLIIVAYIVIGAIVIGALIGLVTQ